MNEDLKKIFEGMELTGDFKKKFEEIYEARITEEKKQIEEAAEQAAEEKYSALAEEYSQYVVAETEEKMDAYLSEEVIPAVERYMDHVAQEFVAENKMVIESETKVELADKFLSGFSQIAEQYNVTVPEGQDDVVADLKGKLAEANDTVDRLLSKTEQLKEQVEANAMSDIVDAVASGMTETQKERFFESCAKVKFHNEGQYKAAVQELYESFSPESEKEQITESKDKGVKEKIVESDSWLDGLLSKV
jgi:predicted P-loop ATPase/GTPase